mgnify:CR=1 FL=1
MKLIKRKLDIIGLSVLATILTMMSAATFAGTDTTFTSVYTTLSSWLEGSLGKVLAVAMIGVGLGIGIAKQSVMAVVLFFGVSLVLVNITAVIGLLFTATI